MKALIIKYDSYGHITGTDNVTSSDLPSHSHSEYITSATVGSWSEVNMVAEQGDAGFGKLFVNPSIRLAHFQWSGDINVTESGTFKKGQVNIGTIPSGYRPAHPVGAVVDRDCSGSVRIMTDGTIYRWFGTTGTKYLMCSLFWHY